MLGYELSEISEFMTDQFFESFPDFVVQVNDEQEYPLNLIVEIREYPGEDGIIGEFWTLGIVYKGI